VGDITGTQLPIDVSSNASAEKLKYCGSCLVTGEEDRRDNLTELKTGFLRLQLVLHIGHILARTRH
jgi:hypothetical protein